MKPAYVRNRVVIEDVSPQIDAGRHPACRIIGDEVAVTAAIFADGRDHLAARLLYRHNSEQGWRFTPMIAATDDLWTGSFTVDKLGSWSFTVMGWIDHFDTWTSDLREWLAAQPDPHRLPPDQLRPDQPGAEVVPQDISLALRSGAILLQEVAERASGADAKAPAPNRPVAQPPGRSGGRFLRVPAHRGDP